MPLSEEDLAQIKDALGLDSLLKEVGTQTQKAINGALSDYNKRAKEAFAKELEPLTTKIAEFEEKAKAAPPTTQTGGDGQPKTPSVQDTPEWRGMQKKLQELEQKAKLAEEREQAERTKSQDASLRQKLGDALTAHKIEGTRAKHAVGNLVDAEKRVRWSEDGRALVFIDTDGSELDLATGLASWVKTEDAKLYLPPSGVRGAGTRPGGSNPGTPATKDQAADRLFEALDRAL